MLVDVRQIDRVPQLDRSGVGGLLADDHPEEGRLSGPVRADDADHRPARDVELDIFDQRNIPAPHLEPLRKPGNPQDFLAQTAARGDLDDRVALIVDRLLGGQLIVRLHARGVLLKAAAVRFFDPLQFPLEDLLPLGLFLLDDTQQLGLLGQPAGVVPLEGEPAGIVDLEDPLGDVVEEVAVVRDDNHRSGVVAQRPLEPLDRLGVEVVGRLVQKEQIGALQQRHTQGDPAALPPGKGADDRVVGGENQRVGGDIDPAVELPPLGVVDLLLQAPHLLHQFIELVGVLGVPHLDGDLVEAVDLLLDRGQRGEEVFADGGVQVEHRFLGDVADRHPLDHLDGPVDVFVEPRHDFEEGRLSGAVFPDDPDLRPVVER